MALEEEGLGLVPASAAVDPRYPSPEQLPEDDTPLPAFAKDYGRELWTEAKDESFIIAGHEDLDRLAKEYEDTGWRMSDEQFSALPNSYDNDQLEALRDSVSEEERDDLRSEFDEANERRAFLADQGWQGVTAQIGATLLDPVLWGATVGAEVGGVALVGAQLTRLGRLTRALASAGVAESAMIGIRSQAENDYGESDMAFDFIAALTVTGVLEGTLGNTASQLVKARNDDVEQAITDKSMGAAERQNDAGKWRVDEYGKKVNSGNQEAATWAKTHLQDPIGGGSDSTAVKAQRLRDNYMAKTNAAFDELWKAKKAEGAGSWWNAVENAKQRAELSEQIWEARVLSVDHGPEVQKVANEFGAQYDKMLADAEDAGLAGFTREMSNPLYMKQEWDSRQWLQLEAQGVSKDEMAELIERGLYGFDEEDLLATIDLKKAEIDEINLSNPKIREGVDESLSVAAKKELAELEAIRDARTRLAIGFNKRMRDSSDASNTPLTELLEDEVGLVKWLRDHDDYKNLTEDEVTDMVKKALSPARKSGDVVDRAKKRIQIDPTAELTTKAGKVIRVADLMNKDAMGLHQSYVNSMSGHVAFAQNGLKRPSDFEDIKNAIRQQERMRLKDDPDYKKKAEKLVESVERDRREIYGLPRHDISGTANRAVSLAMKYNFTTSMGMAAFSALSEMGRILSENGIRNTLKTITAMDGLFSDSMRVINKGDHVVREVNGFTASIGDEQLVRLFNSFDETGVREGTHTAGFLNKAEIVGHRGAQIMARASLLAPVDKALRLLSFSASTNSLYAHLIKGKKTKLAFDQMGLTPNDLAEIKTAMQQHTKAGTFGHVEKLGIEKWPLHVSDKFMNALTTNGARQVQKALAGETVDFVSRPVARIFFQFRKFSIDSYSKHLRADARDFRNDPTRVALSTMYASIFAGLAYYSRTMATAVGMDEREQKEFLEDRLSPERVAANAVNYTPNLGVGVTAWNATAGTLNDDWAIPISRSTGLKTDVLANPTADKVQRFTNLFHNIGDADSDNLIKRGRQFIPAQNTLPVNAALNAAESIIK